MVQCVLVGFLYWLGGVVGSGSVDGVCFDGLNEILGFEVLEDGEVQFQCCQWQYVVLYVVVVYKCCDVQNDGQWVYEDVLCLVQWVGVEVLNFIEIQVVKGGGEGY